MKNARLWVALGLVAGCGGAPPTTSAPAAPAHEDFGPGLVSHTSPFDEVVRDATRVLSVDHKIAPSGEPGVVTTEWAMHDAASWPGAETRVKVEITKDKVIVRVQCRAAGSSCARTVPADIQLVTMAQEIADQIVLGRLEDEILVAMRGFTKKICACVDIDCVNDVEKQMMEWAMKNMDKLKGSKPTRAQEDEATRIEDRMAACKEKLESTSSSSTWRPSTAESTGSRECDEYLETFDLLVDVCKDKLGPALDALKQSRDAQSEAFKQWATLDEASRRATIDAAATGCRSATDALRQSAQAMGCRL